MILEYSTYQKNKFQEKFFEFVMFLKEFYKKNLKTNQTYLVQGGMTGAPISREFSINDYSKEQQEMQCKMSLFNDEISMIFLIDSTNEYTKALKEIIKGYSYKTVDYYTSGIDYYIKIRDIDKIMLKIINDIEQYVDVNKYNL